MAVFSLKMFQGVHAFFVSFYVVGGVIAALSSHPGLARIFFGLSQMFAPGIDVRKNCAPCPSLFWTFSRPYRSALGVGYEKASTPLPLDAGRRTARLNYGGLRSCAESWP